jgi:hypothetical protein
VVLVNVQPPPPAVRSITALGEEFEHGRETLRPSTRRRPELSTFSELNGRLGCLTIDGCRVPEALDCEDKPLLQS